MTPQNKTNSLIVQKYGGATLSTPEKIKAIAARIFNLHTSGVKIVVVVSAMGETTNQLIQLANEVSHRPQLRELDMLLTVGERISMSLLSMALNDLGCAAISFTGSQAGIITDDSHVNANIIEVKAYRVEEALKENKVVILAGFQGVSKNTKEITTLGRGGSDITAVAMAAYLNADRCEILKDVNGIYSADPKIVSDAKLISYLNYEQLLAMTFWGAKVLHFSSVKLASEKNVTLYVGPAKYQNQNSGTIVTAALNTDANIALSINSFSTVLTIETTKSFDEFQFYLQKNQIGWCSLLHEVSNIKYITASNEVLNAIIIFEKSQNEFEIKKNDLSVVTITYKKEVTGEILNTCTHILEKNEIVSYQTLKTKNSLHFFINSNQKNEATQILHQFIL